MWTGWGTLIPPPNSSRCCPWRVLMTPDGIATGRSMEALGRIVRNALQLLRHNPAAQSLGEALRLTSQFEGEQAVDLNELVHHIDAAPAADPIRLAVHQ